MVKRALLFGINQYDIPGVDLRGCVNDVDNIATALHQFCGFPNSGIKKLTNKKATTAVMKREITNLVGNAKAGDVLFIHYSGHGSSVPDTSGDEADMRDEILCPFDMNWTGPITDDWMREQFDQVAEGVNLTVVLDCCHSGTATREPPPRNAKVIDRYLACPLDLMAVESGRRLRGRVRRHRGRPKRSFIPRSLDDGATRYGGTKATRVSKPRFANMPETLLTGCREDQVSADTKIGSAYSGAMSYALVKAIRKTRGKLTYRELHQEMLTWLDGKFDQVPQLEGRKGHVDLGFLEPF